jgi:hypothetical protein
MKHIKLLWLYIKREYYIFQLVLTEIGLAIINRLMK